MEPSITAAKWQDRREAWEQLSTFDAEPNAAALAKENNGAVVDAALDALARWATSGAPVADAVAGDPSVVAAIITKGLASSRAATGRGGLAALEAFYGRADVREATLDALVAGLAPGKTRGNGKAPAACARALAGPCAMPASWLRARPALDATVVALSEAASPEARSAAAEVVLAVERADAARGEAPVERLKGPARKALRGRPRAAVGPCLRSDGDDGKKRLPPFGRAAVLDWLAAHAGALARSQSSGLRRRRRDCGDRDAALRGAAVELLGALAARPKADVDKALKGLDSGARSTRAAASARQRRAAAAREPADGQGDARRRRACARGRAAAGARGRRAGDLARRLRAALRDASDKTAWKRRKEALEALPKLRPLACVAAAAWVSRVGPSRDVAARVAAKAGLTKAMVFAAPTSAQRRQEAALEALGACAGEAPGRPAVARAVAEHVAPHLGAAGAASPAGRPRRLARGARRCSTRPTAATSRSTRGRSSRCSATSRSGTATPGASAGGAGALLPDLDTSVRDLPLAQRKLVDAALDVAFGRADAGGRRRAKVAAPEARRRRRQRRRGAAGGALPAAFDFSATAFEAYAPRPPKPPAARGPPASARALGPRTRPSPSPRRRPRPSTRRPAALHARRADAVAAILDAFRDDALDRLGAGHLAKLLTVALRDDDAFVAALRRGEAEPCLCAASAVLDAVPADAPKLSLDAAKTVVVAALDAVGPETLAALAPATTGRSSPRPPPRRRRRRRAAAAARVAGRRPRPRRAPAPLRVARAGGAAPGGGAGPHRRPPPRADAHRRVSSSGV
ncbi:hypothetical protein JL721_329 [Aureococcus anophagefferens]|nr:hypothetical protein JL721_329 [Aureococcus anophagefferens]